MKKLVIVLLMLISMVGLQAQIITDNPRIDYPYRSSGGFQSNIQRIAVDEDYTYVFFECIVPRRCQGCWISLNSNTLLTAADGSQTLRVIEWGVINESNDPSSLNFNEQYSVKNDRRYVLYMLFPRLKSGITKINIVERSSNGSEGWAWRGVHINNPSGGSFASRSSRRDSERSGYDDNGSSSSRSGGSYSGRSSSQGGNAAFELAGTGTCFAIASKGYLATCYHVVETASRIRIRGVAGDFDRTYDARIVITDKSNDLAILKIEDPDFSSFGTLPYTVANKMIDVGEDVFALGYPLKAYMGDEIKLTNGIVSSRTGFQGDATSYQLSVAVYPGNSGGPLFDSRGNVVGVVNARLLESATYAVKTPYLHTLAQSADNVVMGGSNQLADLSLAEKVKRLRQFVYVIEIAE